MSLKGFSIFSSGGQAISSSATEAPGSSSISLNGWMPTGTTEYKIAKGFT